MFLAGVFLDDSSPTDPAPSSLIFTNTTDLTQLSPELRQVFFIGNGRALIGGESHVRFKVPEEATRFFLGFADSGGFSGPPMAYTDNVGTLAIEYVVSQVEENDRSAASTRIVSPEAGESSEVQVRPIGYIAKSNFNENTDGWLVANTRSNREFDPSYSATDGNPDGYLSHYDFVGHSTWYWQAPEKFLRNVTRAYGETLTFDLIQSGVDSQFDDPDVLLEGQGITLVFDTAENPGMSWTHYRIVFDESAGWTNKETQLAATRAELLTVLSALDKLWIRGEYRVGGDTGGLDNVALAKGTSKPLVQTSEGKPRGILLDLDRQSALVGEWVPIDVVLLNARNEITVADRPYLIHLDVSGGVAIPTEVKIPEGRRAATARVSADKSGEFPVRAVSEPPLPANEEIYTACEKGKIEDLAVAADKSRAPADNKTPINLRITLISKNGTRVSDGTVKEIELVPVEIGRLANIDPEFLPPNQCVQKAKLLSDRPGKATLTVVLFMIVLAGGLIGALARAATDWSESKSWSRLKWTASLFSGVIGALCLYLAYYSGVIVVMPQLSNGRVSGLLLGLVGGYLGLLVLDRLASHLLSTRKSNARESNYNE
jgi:hypothetical protein